MKTQLNSESYVVARNLNAASVGQLATWRVLEVDESMPVCEVALQKDLRSCDDECTGIVKLDEALDEIVEAAQSFVDQTATVRLVASETNRQRSAQDYVFCVRGLRGHVQIDSSAAPHWYGAEDEIDDDEKAEILNLIDAL